MDHLIFGKETSYLIDLPLANLPDRRLRLRGVISRGRLNPAPTFDDNILVDQMVVLDQEIILEIDDLAVIEVPFEGGTYFAMVSAETGSQIIKQAAVVVLTSIPCGG